MAPSAGAAGRVIAGTARGIRLVGAGDETRALGDRVKQALFAILEPSLRGARFLDLFAGTGAGGIEALSRGAASAVFVERDRRAIRTIEANLATTRLAGPNAVVLKADVAAWLATPGARQRGPFDVVLVDPPYDEPDLLVRALEGLGDADPGLIGPRSFVVAKHFHRTDLPPRAGLLASVRERRFGETTLTFYRWEEAER